MTKEPNHTVSLNGDWQVRALGKLPESVNTSASGFIGVVPGTVHTALMSAGALPDPFYRNNESSVQWVEDLDWEYSREFELSDEQITSPAIFLVFEGIDTVADVFLNNRKILHTQNMFVSHSVRIERFAKPGKNLIRVVLRSPRAFAIAREKKHGRIFAELDSYRVHIRKAQYSFGWDWGPRLAASGIWRSVRIEFVRHIIVADIHLSTAAVTKGGVKALFTGKFDAVSGSLRGKRVRISIGGGETRWEFIFPAAKITKRELRLSGAVPWWTHDYGDPRLYDVRVEVLDEQNSTLSAREFRTGFREIRILRNRDKTGESFIFELNGRKIFAKGANWIPADSFLPRVWGSDYRELVIAAREANMNMLRVWGGGIYEDEEFYRACDENGILVWQDFMFACASYPEYREFLDEVRDEAMKNVSRISNHPCVAVFCGNNESEWIWKSKTGRPVDEMPGASLFGKQLRAVVAKIAPEVPYWRSSPFGGSEPNSQSEGDHHQWEVWSSFRSPAEYLKNSAGFVSEFGFQAPPSLSAIRDFTKPTDRDMQSEVMRAHNKQVEGTERLFRFLSGEVKIARNFEDIVLQMQLVQAKAIKTGVDHWRSRKWATAGTIFWQLNDCWPVSSWSAVDYGKHPKALFYWAKKFFNPVKVIITDETDRARVFLVNDHAKRIDGDLEIVVSDLRGNKSESFRKSLRLSGDSAMKGLSIPLSGLRKSDTFINVLFRESETGRIIDQDQRILVPWMDFAFEKPNVSIGVGEEGETKVITVKSDVFMQGVFMPLDEGLGELSDNFFTLLPGTEKSIRYSGRSIPEGFQPKFPLLASL